MSLGFCHTTSALSKSSRTEVDTELEGFVPPLCQRRMPCPFSKGGSVWPRGSVKDTPGGFTPKEPLARVVVILPFNPCRQYLVRYSINN